jgi:hypothetical protein
VTRGDEMSEPFYKTSEQYGNGIILEFYRDSYSLVRGYELQDGTQRKRWGFPEKDKSPAEKAIPWKLELGNAEEAVEVLGFFLRQLQGDKATDPGAITSDGGKIPFWGDEMKQTTSEHRQTLAGLQHCLIADRMMVLRVSERLVKSEADYKDYEVQILTAEGKGLAEFERKWWAFAN